MINQQQIPCPNCSSAIPFEPQLLLQGGRFGCPTCTAVVSIAPESIESTKSVMKAYEELKVCNTQMKGR
tara:strand:- start:396 stop:602 length:207 start_codon:yes stop_codon:yes gene_type:complete